MHPDVVVEAKALSFEIYARAASAFLTFLRDEINSPYLVDHKLVDAIDESLVLTVTVTASESLTE